MFSLGKKLPKERFGLLFDIGSGSVGVTIVVSHRDEPLPKILWHARERVSVRQDESLTDTAKVIATALITTSLEVSTQGMRDLHAYNAQARIDTVKVAIAAPWSYTITKSITTTHDAPFALTEKLIADVTDTAEKQAAEMMADSEVMEQLGLQKINDGIIELTANGYPVSIPHNQTVKEVEITHLTRLAPRKLVEAITEIHEKLAPNATLEIDSFMASYYEVVKEKYPHHLHLCLIDITAEATEIGIVRDGTLRYVSHMPVGVYSLARSIAAVCDLPHEEALAYLKSTEINVTRTLSKAKQSRLAEVINSYEASLRDLLVRTGDALSVPNTLFVHTDAFTENFFLDRLTKTFKDAYHSDPHVHFITRKLVPELTLNDSALLLSAFVFHIEQHRTTLT